MIRKLNRKLRGYYNYYGIIGNLLSLQQFYGLLKRLLYKWLNRRGHKQSLTWHGFNQTLDHFQILTPRLRTRRPRRSAATAA